MKAGVVIFVMAMKPQDAFFPTRKVASVKSHSTKYSLLKTRRMSGFPFPIVMTEVATPLEPKFHLPFAQLALSISEILLSCAMSMTTKKSSGNQNK